MSSLYPFRGPGPFTTPIDASWKLHPNNTAVAAMLAAPSGNRVLNVESFAVPVVESNPALPAVPLTIINSGEDKWGVNDLDAVKSLRIADSSPVARGSDAKLVVIDRANDRVIDMWLVERTSRGWSAGWGGVYPLSGNGSSMNPVYVGQGPYGVAWPQPVSRATGSGISSLAGLVTAADLARGRIDHALVFATDRACGPANTSRFFFPATTTDGWVTDGVCMEEGARIQLDPSINLDAMKLSPGERMIGKALQQYGAFLIDNGGSRIGFIAQLPATPSERASFDNAGLIGDYAGLSALPWSSLRVLVPAK